MSVCLILCLLWEFGETSNKYDVKNNEKNDLRSLSYGKEWVIMGNIEDDEKMEWEFQENDNVKMKRKEIVGDKVVYVLKSEETALAYAMTQSGVSYEMFTENEKINVGPGDENLEDFTKKGRYEWKKEIQERTLGTSEDGRIQPDVGFSQRINGDFTKTNFLRTTGLDKSDRRNSIHSLKEPGGLRVNSVCRTSPLSSNRGFSEGYFSWGLDRIDQRNVLLNGESCTPNGGEEVDVYVVDTGVYAHDSFEEPISYAYSYHDPSNLHDTDCHGHGTHVAGLIGSAIYGVAPKAKVFSVKVLDCNGRGDYASMISGLTWIRQNRNVTRRSVVNMSLGSRGGYSSAIESMMREMTDKEGIAIVVSAGNYAESACDSFPASVKETITVGSIDPSDGTSVFSNYGTCVDVFSPGSDIVSCGNGHPLDSRILSGTSMSSPIVAGVVAVLFRKYPNDSVREMRDRLIRMATKNALRLTDPASPNVLVYAGTESGERDDPDEPLRSPPSSSPSEDPPQYSRAVRIGTTNSPLWLLALIVQIYPKLNFT